MQAEKRIRLDVKFFVNQQNTVVTRFLFAAQPLSDGRLIDAEYIGKFLLRQVIIDHKLFYDFYIRHIKNLNDFRSKVLT